MTAPDTEHLSPELVAMLATAARVLDEHLNADGLCAVCGCAWPCERAVLAEHNLAEI